MKTKILLKTNKQTNPPKHGTRLCFCLVFCVPQLFPPPAAVAATLIISPSCSLTQFPCALTFCGLGWNSWSPPCGAGRGVCVWGGCSGAQPRAQWAHCYAPTVALDFRAINSCRSETSWTPSIRHRPPSSGDKTNSRQPKDATRSHGRWGQTSGWWKGGLNNNNKKTTTQKRISIITAVHRAFDAFMLL